MHAVQFLLFNAVLDIIPLCITFVPFSHFDDPLSFLFPGCFDYITIMLGLLLVLALCR